MEDVIDKIFNKALTGPKIFKDKSVLLHTYIPEKLPFREKQISHLAHIFSSLIKFEKGSNVFIYGKPGTGKTAVIKYVIRKLNEFLIKHDHKINISYVNCRIAGTEYRVVVNIARDVSLNLPFTGLSVEEALSRFFKKIVHDNIPFLLVLDEIDSLVMRYGDKILYALTRFGSEYPGIPYIIVGISNNLRFKEYLDPRVLSSLSEEEIVFKPYNSAELEVIINDRIPIAFYPGVVEKSAVKLIAALSGAEHGDARKALDILRVSGEIAEFRGDNKITEEHVREAYSNIDKERILEATRTLPLHSRIILAALLSFEDTFVKSTLLYMKYMKIAKTVADNVLSYRRFQGLVSELAMLGLIEKKIYNYGRRGGRVSQIKFSVPRSEIKNILIEDPILGDLIS